VLCRIFWVLGGEVTDRDQGIKIFGPDRRRKQPRYIVGRKRLHCRRLLRKGGAYWFSVNLQKKRGGITDKTCSSEYQDSEPGTPYQAPTVLEHAAGILM
jgi:hypothetical protein